MHDLFSVYFVNLYMFRAYLGPSLGGTTICIQQLVLIPIVVYIRLYLLMMGLDTPETCRGWRSILRISWESSWLFCTRLYPDARSTKHKNISDKSYGDYCCLWRRVTPCSIAFEPPFRMKLLPRTSQQKNLQSWSWRQNVQ